MPNFMKIERGRDFFLLIWYGMTLMNYLPFFISTLQTESHQMYLIDPDI